ncbi:MAG: ATP-binding protein [Alphaproteobacteria bacterium]|nr:ATP-binding protein [Alphaproteobacteria bacterium]
MRNIVGQAVVGDDLYGRQHELARLREMLGQGEHVLMLAPRRVGKTSLMLELRRTPPGDCDVIYVDVEGGDGPADCVAAILAELAADPRYRSRFEAIPFSSAIKDIFGRFQSASIQLDALRIEVRDAIGREWESAMAGLLSRFASPRDGQGNLLIVLDELPLLVSRMLRTDEGRDDAGRFLSRLRHWRQAPELRGRLRTLVGGSIGLEGVLRRAGMSGLINDLASFRLESWDQHTAEAFLRELGGHYGFRLPEDAAARMLDLLRDPVPYHVQLFFSALRDSCQGKVASLSREVIDRCFAERLAGASGTAHLDHYATRLEAVLDGGGYDTACAILDLASRRRNGTGPAELDELQQRDFRTFASVLHDLEADGYLLRQGGRLCFRSNLVREWWRKRHMSGGAA